MSIKVLIVEPNNQPYVKEIENGLKPMQKIVGGYIEMLELENGVDLVCNEEGKLNNLEFNRDLFDIGIPDIIAGTFFIVGGNNDTGETVSLTDKQIEKYTAIFRL